MRKDIRTSSESLRAKFSLNPIYLQSHFFTSADVKVLIWIPSLKPQRENNADVEAWWQGKTPEKDRNLGTNLERNRALQSSSGCAGWRLTVLGH
jgi:hypothetical protein